MRANLALVQGLFQIFAQSLAVGAVTRHFGRIGANGAGPVAGGVIGGKLSCVQQRLAVWGRRAGGQTKPNGRTDVKACSVYADRHRKGGLQPRRQLHHRFKIKPAHRRKRHCKPTPFKPCHQIAFTQRRSQPFCRPCQHFGLCGAAIAINQLIHAIKLKHKAGSCASGNRTIAQNTVQIADNLLAQRQP